MKNLLLFCLLLVGTVGHGQAVKSPLPIDSTTHKVTYSSVVDVPGTSQAELYSRAREWFATSFGSAKAVLEMDDKEAGKLIGNATGIYYQKFMGKDYETKVWRVINVQVKEGRFKYVISNFAIDTNKGQGGATPIESSIVPAAYDKKGQLKPYMASMFAGVQQSAENQVASLLAAMKKPAAKSDW